MKLKDLIFKDYAGRSRLWAGAGIVALTIGLWIVNIKLNELEHKIDKLTSVLHIITTIKKEELID